MTLKVICPPCGHVNEGESEDELVRNVQAHGLAKHGGMPPREAILAAILPQPNSSTKNVEEN
jgi:predicted small metal-binding protein